MQLQTLTELTDRIKMILSGEPYINEVFLKFAHHALDIQEIGKDFYSGINAVSNLEHNSFHVFIAKRCFRYQLKVYYKEGGGVRGEVCCHEIIDDVRKPIYNFSISEIGDTDMKPPDEVTYLNCTDRKGAWYLIFYGLYRGLLKND